MRKILRQKFWSLGTNLGSPRALGVAPVVQPMFWRVFLFKFGMVYMMTHPIALEKIFLIKLASSDMWYIAVAECLLFCLQWPWKCFYSTHSIFWGLYNGRFQSACAARQHASSKVYRKRQTSLIIFLWKIGLENLEWRAELISSLLLLH